MGGGGGRVVTKTRSANAVFVCLIRRLETRHTSTTRRVIRVENEDGEQDRGAGQGAGTISEDGGRPGRDYKKDQIRDGVFHRCGRRCRDVATHGLGGT